MVILIVDDDPTNLFVLDEFLKTEGYSTVTATNGAEAVEQFDQHKPKLILMDLSMPVMDGFEAARRILEKKSESDGFPTILAVSANVTPEWRASCFEVGMEDFIEKPIDFDYLIPKISDISASHCA
jgi:CheY-like chemotaxis protein